MTLRVVYSFNKTGEEAEFWTREIAAASTERTEFIPFNHETYVNVSLYLRAQLLDNLYHDSHPGLLRMYSDLKALLHESGAGALIVDNALPYHPEFLRSLDVYKVLRTSDGPLTAYDRDFAYLHAYDHVLYHSPAYSRDLDMPSKLAYCGASRTDFWPLALFDAAFDPRLTEERLLDAERDVDVVFVGAPYRGKMPLLATVKKALGRKFRIAGFPLKHSLYFKLRYATPGWVGPRIERYADYVRLYQRCKIGINVHNRGDFTVGSFRLFELPGNGVMQISDGGEYLDSYFNVGREIIRYRQVDDLIDKIRYYLDHEDERREIALNGFRRTMQDHRIAHRMDQAGQLIADGMARSGGTFALSRPTVLHG